MVRLGYLVSVALLSAVVARADSLAITPTAIDFTVDNRDYTTGWAFSTTSSFSVTGLAYFDAGLDGLLSAHDVGIFSSSGTLLVSTTVPTGTAGTLDGDYRVASIAPFLLLPGSYVIGGFHNSASGDQIVISVGAFNPRAGITLGSTDLFALGSPLAFPTEHGLTYANSNFEVAGPSQVPEPATWLTLGTGLLAVLGAARRKWLA